MMRALVLTIVFGGTALADPRSDAKTHIEKAMALHGEGKYDEALGELTAAYRLDPQPDLLYAMAQVDVKLDRCADAIPLYQKYLESRPAAGPAGATREAITVCKTKLAQQPKPEPQPEPKAEPRPEPKPEPKPEAKPEPPPKPEPEPEPKPEPEPVPAAPTVTGPSPWYSDKLGDALVAGGVVAGVVGVVLYSSARSDIDSADHAGTYQGQQSLVDRAHGKATDAAVLGIAGAALLGAGVVHYMLRGGHEATVAVAPGPHGGFVAWSGRF